MSVSEKSYRQGPWWNTSPADHREEGRPSTPVIVNARVGLEVLSIIDRLHATEGSMARFQVQREGTDRLADAMSVNRSDSSLQREVSNAFIDLAFEADAEERAALKAELARLVMEEEASQSPVQLTLPSLG